MGFPSGRARVRALTLLPLLVLATGPTGATSAAAQAPGSNSASSAVDPWQDPVSADQPGVANPPSVVGRGVFQLETAAERISANGSAETSAGASAGAPAHTLDFPTLVRYGVSRALELRVASSLLTHVWPVEPGQDSWGLADVTIGAKWALRAEKARLLPALSLGPSLSLPVGAAAFTAGRMQPGMTALLGWEAGPKLDLDSNVGASRLVGAGGEGWFWQWVAALAPEYSPRRNWSLGAEIFLVTPADPGSGPAWGVDENVLFFPDADTQLDLSLAHVLSGPSRSHTLQLGLSRRWRRLLRPRG